MDFKELDKKTRLEVLLDVEIEILKRKLAAVDINYEEILEFLKNKYKII